MFFENRSDAGRKLADILLKKGGFSQWVVIGIARGGVIVASQISEALGIGLKAICVEEFSSQKGFLVATSLGSGHFYPNSDEEDGMFVPDVSALQLNGKSDRFAKFLESLKQRSMLYNDGHEFRPEAERVILCDDGLVSGMSAFTAIDSLKMAGIQEIVLAIPVVPPWLLKSGIKAEIVTWRITTMENPATGMFYKEFNDTPDGDVIESVRKAKLRTKNSHCNS